MVLRGDDLKHRYSKSANEGAALTYHNQWAQICVLETTGYKKRWSAGEGPKCGDMVVCFLQTVMAGTSKKRPAVKVAWYMGDDGLPNSINRKHQGSWILSNPRIYLDDVDIGRLAGAKVKLKIISNIVSFAVLNKISNNLEVPLDLHFPLPKELEARAAFLRREGILDRRLEKIEEVSI